ncbi:MAG TPA: hypothetical protein VFV03_08835 [Solirubrobacteraceae bacterium]|nr:hypothetical protein [Solirubrobacteraceae bacterium]
MESDALIERISPLGSARALLVARRLSLASVAACVLVGAWLLLAPRSPDLAAQTYRATLFESSGFTVWDGNWYGGHHLPGYSLVFPWLGLLVGIRLVGALAVIVSTFAFERIALAEYGPRARWGTVCFAVAAAGDLWIGRLTFALGVMFAALAVLALVRERSALAAALAAVGAATSPVAGLLLALAGATHVLVTRRARAGLALALPAFLVVLPLEALFPEGGWEPFAASSVAATLAVALAFLYAVPREQRLLRTGALVYLGVTVLSIAPTPMGSNVDRYAVLLAGPLLLCALGRDGFRQRGRSLAVAGLAVAGIVVWTVWGPVRESVGVIGDPSTSAAYYAPLKRFLADHGGSLVRVEIPFTHSHWEAALLAPEFPLARGWERQLDTKYDPLFFGGALTASAYRAWLQRDAVGYVALPDTRLDGSSDEEATLIRKGVPYLREVFSSAHWRVFAVLDPTPLASAPGVLTALDHDSFTLRFASPGMSVVRVRYTRYWTVTRGEACVVRAPGGWTAVSVWRPGAVRVEARFSLGRALGLGGECGG